MQAFIVLSFSVSIVNLFSLVFDYFFLVSSSHQLQLKFKYKRFEESMTFHLKICMYTTLL